MILLIDNYDSFSYNTVSIQSLKIPRIFGFPFCSIMLYCIYTMESR